jgi:beta-lactamase class A
MISRRESLLGALLLASDILRDRPALADDGEAAFQDTMRKLEQRHGGRLGVAVRDTSSNRTMAHRGDERFALCSTFKCLAAAFVLARVDKGEEKLERRVVYGKSDLVTYSPVTEKHAGGDGMTMAEICEAAITLSDNTAGNLMLDSFDGPAGLTSYLHSLGDKVTRLDRRETELNEAAPGDPRDTTTPAAMLELLQKLVLGDALSSASRDQLTKWLVANKTGDKRLRAGLPKEWRVGDKTGVGNHNATNDVAVIWPANRAPLIVAAYYVEGQGSDDERNAVLADVGRFVATM